VSLSRWGGCHFHGIVLAVEDDTLLHVAHQIACHPNWRTPAAVVEQSWGRGTKRLTLEHRGGSRLVDGRLNIPQSRLFIPQSLSSEGERLMSRCPAEIPSQQ